MKLKRYQIILLAITLLLLIPFIAMQFTNEVNWSLFDFAIAGFLLLSLGFLVELVLRKINKLKYQILISTIILIIFLIIWVELAVGIFGTPVAGN